MRLTPREHEVFEAFGEGFTTPEVALLLGISTKTVEIHRLRVVKKLGARSTVDMIRIWVERDMPTPLADWVQALQERGHG